MIQEHARRASSIVQNLLMFSQESSRSYAKLCLKDLMQRALYPHDTTLKEKNIGVKFELSEDLPSVEGDPQLLVRAFSNIIANAEQSITASRNRGSLTISVSTTQENVVVSLADDGGRHIPGKHSQDIRSVFHHEAPRRQRTRPNDLPGNY